MKTELIQALISDLALILVLAAVSTVIFKKLKQPVVLGYIVAGFLASPNFIFLPSVDGETNIEFWAQIGIIVLLFSLGLEFSFKKLLNVGGSAIGTTLIIVLGMMGLGFLTGKSIGFETIDSIFLGGMISMSSTTIILKALTDLNMKQRRFVPSVMAVLIVEDLFAVVMLVILSSIAINKTVAGEEMLNSILRLSFFLVIWFTVGIFLIPSIFKRLRRLVSNEMMLIIAMALCFGMAIFSVWAGFSLALGAFVMGSIIAGTSDAERINRLVTPVKDLFGAVFFISVGMMVNPKVIVSHAGTIGILSVVVVVGMIFFGTFGMLAAGKPLRQAMESGFCLTQIGEFSFIIATTGQSLGVLGKSVYPVIVAVSVITTFFTPFFIKAAIPCYNWVKKKLPSQWAKLLEGYSRNAAESEESESKKLWKKVINRFFTKLIVYSVFIAAIIVAMDYFDEEYFEHWFHGSFIDELICINGTLLLISPFFYAILRPTLKAEERKELVDKNSKISYVPSVVLTIVKIIYGILVVIAIISQQWESFTNTYILIGLAVIFLIILLFSKPLNRHFNKIEKRFVSNMNERENRKTGKDRVVVSDLHLGYMKVGYSCPFVGMKIKDAKLRQKYGVNLVNILRNTVMYPVPDGEFHIYPGDQLGVIGTDEQIQRLLPLVESNEVPNKPQVETKFIHFTISKNSPIVGKSLAEVRLRQTYSALLVSVERDGVHYTPKADFVFESGDTLWIVGDVKKLKELK